MHKQIYVNLPVKDLARTKAFFEAVGYRFNPQFTNDKAAGMELGDNLYAMLLSEDFARTFTPKAFPDGKTATTGKISIELPEIAENGNTVPLSVTVDAPMAADNYVSDILVVAEGNPNPGVVTFHLSPMAGKARPRGTSVCSGGASAATLGGSGQAATAAGSGRGRVDGGCASHQPSSKQATTIAKKAPRVRIAMTSASSSCARTRTSAIRSTSPVTE